MMVRGDGSNARTAMILYFLRIKRASCVLSKEHKTLLEARGSAWMFTNFICYDEFRKIYAHFFLLLKYVLFDEIYWYIVRKL